MHERVSLFLINRAWLPKYFECQCRTQYPKSLFVVLLPCFSKWVCFLCLRSTICKVLEHLF